MTLGGRLLYVCCLLMINFGPSFRATSSVFYQCSFEQKSRTKCVHHIVQQEKKKNGNRSSTVQQQLSDSHSGPRRNISDKNSSQYTEVRNDHFLFIGCLGNPYLEFKWVIENKNVAPKKVASFGTLIPYLHKNWS